MSAEKLLKDFNPVRTAMGGKRPLEGGTRSGSPSKVTIGEHALQFSVASRSWGFQGGVPTWSQDALKRLRRGGREADCVGRSLEGGTRSGSPSKVDEEGELAR